MSRKKFVIIASIICAIILVVTLFIIIGVKLRIINEYRFTNPGSDIGETVTIIRWSSEPYTLYYYNGTLYFYSDRDEAGGIGEGLYKIKGSNATRILSFAQSGEKDDESFYVERPLCFIDGHLIYYSMCNNSENDTISSIDIETGIKKDIFRGEKVWKLVYEAENRTPISDDSSRSAVYQTQTYSDSLGPYFSITSDSVIFLDAFEEDNKYKGDSFVFGDFEYCWDGVWLVRSGVGENIKLGSFGPGQVVEVPGGEYVLIRRTGTSGFWSIDRNGSAKELFPVLQGEKVMTEYIVHDKDLYVSLRRYKVYDKLNVRRFENDSEEGLWKINIETGKKMKLSGEMYISLNMYDESGIVACSYSKDIVVLDFDGKTKAKILTGSLGDHFDEFCRNHLSRAE